MLSQDRSPESAARRNRVLIRNCLPLTAVWILGAWFLGVRDAWLLMGPPGLMLIVLSWWAYDPRKPFIAVAMGAGTTGWRIC